jgi:hypothetical protein
MTYEMALEFEQEQRYEQSVAAEQEREYHEQRQSQSKRCPVRFGKGQLCKCGLKCAEDCNGCPF